MRVVVVSSSDIDGGAAKAAFRLHKAFRKNGLDSRMVVQSKRSDDWSVVGSGSQVKEFFSLLRPRLDQFRVLLHKKRNGTLFSPSELPFGGLVERINALKPDIVNLHWVAGGALRTEELAGIEAPIVWTLHDNWILTGGCHVMWGCARVAVGCGRCPVLGSIRDNDLSAQKFRLKKKKLGELRRLTLVPLSRWLMDQCQSSDITRNIPAVCIPNPIDCRRFFPMSKELARKLLGLPENRKLVLFGAINSLKDLNKGSDLLVSALAQIQNRQLELVVFGASEPENPPEFGFPAHFLGKLHDEQTMNLLYNACDVTVVPSRQENLSNVIMESLSCGTKVVAFDVGGNSDLVRNEDWGYLVPAFSVVELASTIERAIHEVHDDRKRNGMHSAIESNFSESAVVGRYKELFKTQDADA